MNILQLALVILLTNGNQIALDGLFVALGCMGSEAIAKSLGIFIDMSGSVRVDSNGMTNMRGLYAAGDCASGAKQIAKAVCDGMNVGLNIVKEFKHGYRK